MKKSKSVWNKKTKCIYTIVVLMKRLCHTNIQNRKACSKHEKAICSLQMQIRTIKRNKKKLVLNMKKQQCQVTNTTSHIEECNQQ